MQSNQVIKNIESFALQSNLEYRKLWVLYFSVSSWQCSPTCSVILKYNVAWIIFSITFEFSTQERQIHVKLTCEAMNQYRDKDRKYTCFHRQHKQMLLCFAYPWVFKLVPSSETRQKDSGSTPAAASFKKFKNSEIQTKRWLCREYFHSMRTQKLPMIPGNHVIFRIGQVGLKRLRESSPF